MGRGKSPDPSEGERESEPTRFYDFEGEGETEVVPVEHQAPVSGHAGIDVPVPPTPLPVPAGPPPIPVRRSILLTLLTILIVLLVAVGALIAVVLGHSNKALATTTSTSSPTSTTASAIDSSSASSDPSAGSTAGAGSSPSDGASAGPSPSADSASPSTDVTPSESFSPPFGTQYLTGPVDGSGVGTNVDVKLSSVDYPNSVNFYCPTNGLLDWDVAGYSTFTTTFGIPDDAPYAAGITNTITFTNENGKTLGSATTTVGQPAKVSFALNGAVRLVITCTRQGSNDSADNVVALGNAEVSTSSSG